jgi:transaldolase
MPEETIVAFQDHGIVKDDTLESGLDEARELFTKLEQVGIAYDDVTDTLEKEGVQKFTDSFVELKEGIAEKRNALATV